MEIYHVYLLSRARVRNETPKNFDEVKTAAPNSFEEVKTAAPNSFEEVETAAPNSFDEVKTAAPNSFDEVKTSAPTRFDEVKAAAPESFDEVKTVTFMRSSERFFRGPRSKVLTFVKIIIQGREGSIPCADPEGDRGSEPPPLKNHKNIGVLSKTGLAPLETH